MRWLCLSLCLYALGAASAARARSQEELRYRYEDIWNAAVRLVRVELGLSISERDRETGFFLFAWIDHDKEFPGSFELVRRGGSREPVTAVVHIGGMPRYVERMILTKLQKKLENEYGAPLPPPSREPEPPDEDEPPAQDEPDDSPDQGEEGR